MDTLNATLVSYTVDAIGAAGFKLRTQILGSNDDVNYQVVSASITTTVGTPDSHQLSGGPASFRFYKAQERRDSAGNAVAARIRGSAKGGG